MPCALTKVEGIWTGGAVTQLDMVTTAVGHGHRAAQAIDRKSLGKTVEPETMPVIRTDKMRLDHYDKMDRQEPSALDVDQRLGAMDVEVNRGLTADQVIEESGRCMSCGYCFDCGKCWLYCQDQAIDKPMQKSRFKLENCTGGRKCAEECPCGFIEMH